MKEFNKARVSDDLTYMIVDVRNKTHPNAECLLDIDDYKALKQLYDEKKIGRLFPTKGSRNNTLYIYYTVATAHREIIDKQENVFLHRHFLPDSECVDHINHDSLDNRRANIRSCTRAENSMNTTSRKNSTSKYLGVWWEKGTQRWMAKIRVNGKSKYLKCSKTDEEICARAYDEAAKEYHGEFANLNFPE